MNSVSWWPPKVGDALREVWGMDPAEDRLLHVVSVFEHDKKSRIVTAVWCVDRRRWSYSVNAVEEAIVGMIRPDGTPRVS